MSRRGKAGISLLVLSLATCGRAPVEEARVSCTPSFREISDEPIEAPYASWKLFFSVALIGCKESLKSLTSSELATVQDEFREPSEWSNLLLYADSQKGDFRARATARTNALLDREVVTDVLISDLTIVDHNAPLGGD